MYHIISLLGYAAAAAAAFFTYNTITSNRLLDEQYRQLRDTAAKISAASKHPAAILVMGFENHGRSSFINTVFRVLYRESGPLIMRAETAPSKKTTTAIRVFRVKNKLLMYPKYIMSLIDTPTLSMSDALDEEKVRTILRGECGGGWKQRGVPPPECVVLVVRSDAAGVGGPASQMLPHLARVIREEGLQFVVVLTHKKEARKAMDLQELIRQVTLKVGTDSVKCIDNYIAEHRVDEQNGVCQAPHYNFDTHIHTLSIVRQCLEYVKRRRKLNKSLSSSSLRKSKSLSALDEFQRADLSSASE